MKHIDGGLMAGRTVLVTGATSGYLANRRPTKSSARSYDLVVAARLWEASEDLVTLASTPRA